MPQDNPSSEPHRWGQITKGPYHRISKDVSVGHRFAKLNYHEGLVIEYLIEHSWTSPYVGRRSRSETPAAVPIRLSPTEIAEDLGLDRPRVSLAISSLVACRLVLETPAGHLINKQAPEWTKLDGSPRLTQWQLDRCIRAARSERYPSVTKTVTQGRRIALPLGNGDDGQTLPLGNGERYPSVTESVTQGERENRPPLEPPTGERTREEEVKTKEDFKDNTTQSVVVASEKDEERHRKESILQAESGLWSRDLRGHVFDGPNEPDRARLDVAGLICDRLDLHYQIRPAIEQHCRVWPSEWFVLVLKYCHHSGNRPGSWKYLKTILEGWADRGCPQAGEWDYLDDNLRPLMPSQRTARTPSRPAQLDAPTHPSYVRVAASRIYRPPVPAKEIA